MGSRVQSSIGDNQNVINQKRQSPQMLSAQTGVSNAVMDKIFTGMEDLMKMLNKLMNKMTMSCNDKSVKDAIEWMEGTNRKGLAETNKTDPKWVGPNTESGTKKVRILTLDESKSQSGFNSFIDNAKALICYHLNDTNKNSLFSRLNSRINKIDSQQNKLLALNKYYEERM